MGKVRNIEHTFTELNEDLEVNFPHLALRRLGTAAAFAYAESGGELVADILNETIPAEAIDGANFINLYTIGYGLIRDSYHDASIPMPPDADQQLWYDRNPPITNQEFMDCLNLAQIEITEKYPVLQLALQSFAKDKRVHARYPSPRAAAIASVAASELFDSFAQMEAARDS